MTLREVVSRLAQIEAKVGELYDEAGHQQEVCSASLVCRWIRDVRIGIERALNSTTAGL